MFCALPFPWHGWEEKARDRMLLCLPVIGLEIGLIWWGVGTLCRLLALPELLSAAVLCAAPYLILGQSQARTGSYNAAWIIFAVLTLAAAVMFYFTNLNPKRDPIESEDR